MKTLDASDIREKFMLLFGRTNCSLLEEKVENSDHNLIFIYGKPHSGKTLLSRRLADTLLNIYELKSFIVDTENSDLFRTELNSLKNPHKVFTIPIGPFFINNVKIATADVDCDSIVILDLNLSFSNSTNTEELYREYTTMFSELRSKFKCVIVTSCLDETDLNYYSNLNPDLSVNIYLNDFKETCLSYKESVHSLLPEGVEPEQYDKVSGFLQIYQILTS